MQMDAGLDTGDILLTRHIAIPDGMNAGELLDDLSVLSGPMVVEVLKGLKAGTIKPVKQSEEGIAYAHKITKDECRIDWKKSAHEVRQKILGLSPHPGAFFVYKGENIKVLGAQIPELKEKGSFIAGSVYDEHFTVACGEGFIRVTSVTRPGKKQMPAEDMLIGYPILPGEILE
jgi:methionyl-tRNA formyltransferase